MNIYYAIVKWYNDNEDNYETSTLITVGNSYQEAIEKIEKDLCNIENIEIETISIGWSNDSINCIYIDDSTETYNMLKELNDC